MTDYPLFLDSCRRHTVKYPEPAIAAVAKRPYSQADIVL